MLINTDRSLLSLLKAYSVKLLGAQAVPVTIGGEESRFDDEPAICNQGCHIDKQGLVVFKRAKTIGKGNCK